MNEEMIRAMVREAVARRLAEPSEPVVHVPAAFFAAHASHGRYPLTPSDGPCVIEPGVPCNHCGYCESHGH
ncbi:MAG: hypothetical protein ABI818_14600 [Acidobacteriota bacterium]